MHAPNTGYNYTIPPCLQPGAYLVRHELIALHSAWAAGEAQFYPSCHQLRVTGSGTINPTEGLVSFPGAYKADDVGIFIDVWNRRCFFSFSFVFCSLPPFPLSPLPSTPRPLLYRFLGLTRDAAGNYTIPGPEVFQCPE